MEVFFGDGMEVGDYLVGNAVVLTSDGMYPAAVGELVEGRVEGEQALVRVLVDVVVPEMQHELIYRFETHQQTRSKL